MTESTSSSTTLQYERHPLRIGTWNVLLYDDEYDSNYGCPLSIAFCSNTSSTAGSITSNDDDNDDVSRKKECTKQRQQRVWNVIEESYTQYDVLCLQEVNDDFLSLQQVSSSSLSSSLSNWTMVHRNMECVILLSLNSTFSVISRYNISTVPNLSGCTALPIVVLQQQQEEPENNTNPISYLVGSVHVQASVTNMSFWYQSTIDAIVNTTYNEVVAVSTNDYDWMKQPVLIIIAGDFNHNLTTTTAPATSSNMTVVPTIMVEQPPYTNWTIVSPNHDNTLIQGTTQKEYNYMGYYDGFLYSTTSIQLYIPENDTTIGTIVSSMNENSTTTTTTAKAISSLYSMNVTNVTIHTMDGFMPKVIYGFPQINRNTIQTIAQFALISNQNNNTTSSIDPQQLLSNYTVWNASTVQEWIANNTNNINNSSLLVAPMDLQLIFSKSSIFPFTFASTNDTNNSTNDTILVPKSHPLHDSLSDHLFISASFHVVIPTLQHQPSDSNSSINNNSSTNNNNTDPSTTNKRTDESSSPTLSRPNLSPGGWTLVVIGLIVCIGIVLRIFGYCRRPCRGNTNVARSHDFDRITADSIN